MKEETKKQYSIIANKNWTVMKRNPGELVMDIVYVINSLLESKISYLHDLYPGCDLNKPRKQGVRSRCVISTYEL